MPFLRPRNGTAAEPWHFDFAAMAIGFAVFFDGLDGRIARMTHTESDFGRELDSLADVITFGVAPALLAWMWGFHLLPATLAHPTAHQARFNSGTIACFAFLMAGASRLARFNITTNPQPSNPGRPGKKYFVGMPIPAGAGVIAAVVHFLGRRAARLLAHLAELAADGDGRRLPYGQHLALLQLQRH